MDKFDILVAGHEGQVSLAVTNKNFTGAISSPDGSGSISGSVADDGSLIGTAYIGVHTAGFVATISGDEISGHLKVGFWPFAFVGHRIA